MGSYILARDAVKNGLKTELDSTIFLCEFIFADSIR